jgi:outer membrane protein assembly factor BamD (BamD/ComL family)
MCMIGVAISANGQDRPADSAALPPVPPNCTQELFDRAETSYRIRWRDSEILVRAERELKEVIRNCSARPEGYQAEEHLQIVQEELAETNYLIAKFYLSRFYDGRGGGAGARARLNVILERYPKYTKLDEVLSLLGQVNIRQDYLDDAASNYQRLVKDYPYSQYAGEAFIQLSVINVMKLNQRP